MASQLNMAVQSPTVQVMVTADPVRDERTVQFWECVNELIFDEDRTVPRKGSILRRYSRALTTTGQFQLADMAGRLADSYSETISHTHHW